MCAAARTAGQPPSDGARERESQSSNRQGDVALGPLVVREGCNRRVGQGLLTARCFFWSLDA
jgi:hypothetical protein